MTNKILKNGPNLEKRRGKKCVSLGIRKQTIHVRKIKVIIGKHLMHYWITNSKMNDLLKNDLLKNDLLNLTYIEVENLNRYIKNYKK